MADLNALIVFARVVEANSFSEAARRLGMPLSTISRRIAELEAELGVRLLERSTRKLRLTDMGTRLLRHAQESIGISDTIDCIVRDDHAKVSGILKISSPPSVSDTLLAPLIRAFQAAYPEVRVEAFITQRMIDHIEEGIDIAFRIGPLPDSSLVARKLLSYRHRLFAAPSLIEAEGQPTHPSDLQRYRLAAFSYWRRQHKWQFVHRTNGDHFALPFEPYVAMNDYNGIARLLADGGMIGELPLVIHLECFPPDTFVEIPPDWQFALRDLSLVHSAAAISGSMSASSRTSPQTWRPSCFPTCMID